MVFVDNLLLEDKGGSYELSLQPHLGLTSLIAVIEAKGHEGWLYDPKLEVARGRLQLDASLYRCASEAILAMSPDVVGFTSLGCNFICTLKIASYLRQNAPEIPILLGGPHASVLDRHIVERFAPFDVIVRHEAERTICDVLERAADREFGSIPGVTYRHGGKVVVNPPADIVEDLDTLPIPAFHKYPIEQLGLRSLRIEAGRGCPFKCTFCSTAQFFGRRYRLHSPQRILTQMHQLETAYGIREFSLTHDLFTVSRKKIVEFCDVVAGSGYEWKCSARMDCVDSELLRIMREAGCTEIYYGVETGSKRMQKISKKHLDLDLFDPVLDTTLKLGIGTTVSFITGYPEESQDDHDATLDRIGACARRLADGLNVQLHLLTPEPGTELISLHKGLKYDGYISDFNFPTLEPDDSIIMTGNADVFVNHHYYESTLPRDRHILAASLHLILQQLGPALLAHILFFFEGRLSVMADKLYAWVCTHKGKEGLTDEDLVGYLRSEFGNESYLGSIVEYSLTVARLANRLPSRDVVPISHEFVQATSDLSILAPGVGVMVKTHRCPDILKFVRENPNRMVPIEMTSERVNYVMQFHDGDVEQIRNFSVGTDGVELLQRFRSPNSFEQVINSSADPERALTFSDFLDQMLYLGILVRVDNLASSKTRQTSRNIVQGTIMIPKRDSLPSSLLAETRIIPT